MVYLKNFKLPEMIAEELFLNDIRQTCYDSFYPFGIFPQKGFSAVDFEPITIFYGSNGSGKTTLLNVIAEAIGAQRSAPYNNSSFFADFSRMCQVEWESYYQDSTIITSDDVFDYLFDPLGEIRSRSLSGRICREMPVDVPMEKVHLCTLQKR